MQPPNPQEYEQECPYALMTDNEDRNTLDYDCCNAPVERKSNPCRASSSITSFSYLWCSRVAVLSSVYVRFYPSLNTLN